MITTRIAVVDPDGEAGPYNTRFRRVVVNWNRDGVLRTVTSAALLDTAPPEEVARALRDLAQRIERTCGGRHPLPPAEPFPADWARFVEDVNRMDARLKDREPFWRDIASSDLDGSGPVFEFLGWRVFRR